MIEWGEPTTGARDKRRFVADADLDEGAEIF
jgi:hypothetical protein